MKSTNQKSNQSNQIIPIFYSNPKLMQSDIIGKEFLRYHI